MHDHTERRSHSPDPSSTSLGLHVRGRRGDGRSGVSLGVHVAGIVPGSAVARDGHVQVGDRILSVNGETLDQISDVRCVPRARLGRAIVA